VRIAFFAHSWRSDWNHGNAHFLRGVAGALTRRGHVVRTFEPHDAWSARELAADRGPAALDAFRAAYPALRPELYDEATVDLDALLDGAELVVVHEWTAPALVARIGRHRRDGGRYTLLFHDTHHRSVSSPADIAGLVLDDYDGVLAFGETVRERYVRAGWSRLVWTWHEAADVRVFRPHPAPAVRDDLVFIGNWGDDERTRELGTFLFAPARALGLSGHVHGVRYPPDGIASVEAAGLAYAGYAPNHQAPAIFARHRVTVHVPRAPYARALAGVPTIRMFEALACGIPLVSAPWTDSEGLFRAGTDYLTATDTPSMVRQLGAVLQDRALAASLAAAGLKTIASRHTCDHRVDELMRIVESLRGRSACEVVAS
jgi:spore maturation protein CgeB